MSVRSFVLTSLFMATAALTGPQGHAADAPPPIVDAPAVVLPRYELPGAISMSLTPRGQKVFEQSFQQILGNIGFDLSQGDLPEINYGGEKPLDLNQLEKDKPGTGELLKNIRSLLTKWLLNFPLQEHRPTVRIAESDYEATFSKFGLLADKALLRKLGKKDGAVLVIEAEVSKIDAKTKTVRAWDAGNPHLGEIGVDDANAIVGDKKTPLKIRAPFYIRMNADRILEFQALEVQDNINTVPLEIKYQKMISPSVVLEINGQRYQMNNKELENYIQGAMPDILKIVRDNLKTFVTAQLPKFLNDKTRESIKSLERSQIMPAPGKEDADKREDFQWGLLLRQINHTDLVNIGLSAWVEDPTVEKPVAPSKALDARGPPVVNEKSENFDVALSVNRSLVNRILLLAFNRKNFEKIPVGEPGEEPLRLTMAPIVDFIARPKNVPANPKEAWIQAKVGVEVKPDSWFLEEKIQISFTIIAKLKQSFDKRGVVVVLHSIDLNSLAIDPRYLSSLGEIAPSLVYNGVQGRLKELSSGWTKKETSVSGTIPIPPSELLGMKLDLQKIEMQSNGHLMMYSNFILKPAEKSGK